MQKGRQICNFNLKLTKTSNVCRVLTWEDAYCDDKERINHSGSNWFDNMNDYVKDERYTHDLLESAIANMYYQVYYTGEGYVDKNRQKVKTFYASNELLIMFIIRVFFTLMGRIIGQVAATGKHLWISGQQLGNSLCSLDEVRYHGYNIITSFKLLIWCILSVWSLVWTVRCSDFLGQIIREEIPCLVVL